MMPPNAPCGAMEVRVRSRGLVVAIVGVFLILCAVVIAIALKKPPNPDGVPSAAAVSAPSVPVGPGGPSIEVLVSSSDGKKTWLEAVAKAFMASGAKVGERPIKIKLLHMKSGESLKAILDGHEKPAIWSPASQSWLDLLNTTWTTRHSKPLVVGAKRTVMSPLVIAIWEPMAQALGWPGKPIGWEEIFKVAADPKGWASLGHPEWGSFRFGHAHPDYSTSAMMSVLSSIYAASGKTAGLTSDDLKSARVLDRVGSLERAVVHYGESSTGLTEKLCTKGPAYLSAVTLYEANVVKANDQYKAKMPFPLVAIYPKEGTFWEDHPTGLVDADWVSAEQRQGAEAFLAFLTAPAQQKLAMTFAYRPTDPSMPLEAPIDRAHGVDPSQTAAKKLAYVSEELFTHANELWHQVKKKATVLLLLDTSGSMQGPKMTAAKKGAVKFLRSMHKDDEVGVITFSTRVSLLRPIAPVREVGEILVKGLEGLFAEGQTSMIDAALEALDEIERRKKAGHDRLYGIVLLSDGQDTSSKKTMSDLTSLLPAQESPDGTRIFTVGYGEDAEGDVLRNLAVRSNAQFFEGKVENIEKVYHQISAYF